MLILAVDDEPIALRYMERTLKKIYDGQRDVKILCSDNYIDALEAIRCVKEKPDIAFLDVEMPEMNGIELARRLQEENPRMNIIFVTAYDEFALDAINLYASGYITKPYMQTEIEKELEHLRYPIQKPEEEHTLSEKETSEDTNSSAAGGSVFSKKKNVEKKLRIQCFGNFEVFSNERPLHFQRRGSKEILAFLVSRKGASCTRLEISSAIWETAEEIEQKKDYFRILISALRQTLKRYDAEEVLITTRDSFAIDKQAVECDFYRYLDGDRSPQYQYRGVFMQQYTWAEDINAILSDELTEY